MTTEVLGMTLDRSALSTSVCPAGGTYAVSGVVPCDFRRIRRNGSHVDAHCVGMVVHTVAGGQWAYSEDSSGSPIAFYRPSTLLMFCFRANRAALPSILLGSARSSLAHDSSSNGVLIMTQPIVTFSESVNERTAQYLRETFDTIRRLVEQAWARGDNRREDAEIADILSSFTFRSSLADALYRPTDEQVLGAMLGKLVPPMREVGGTVVPDVFTHAFSDSEDFGPMPDSESDSGHHVSSLCDDCPIRDTCETYKREGKSPLDSALHAAEQDATESLLRFFEDTKPEDMD